MLYFTTVSLQYCFCSVFFPFSIEHQLSMHSKPCSQPSVDFSLAVWDLYRISYRKWRTCECLGTRLCRTVLQSQPTPSPTFMHSTVLLNRSKRCTIFKGLLNTPCSRVSRTSQHITWLSKAAAEEKLFINKSILSWNVLLQLKTESPWALLGDCHCFTILYFHLITESAPSVRSKSWSKEIFIWRS